MGIGWDLENATNEAYYQKQTLTKEDIHAICLHKSKLVNKAISGSFIKSCTYCGTWHKQGQCLGKTKSTLNVQNRSFAIDADHPTGHKFKVNRQRHCCR